MRHRKKKVKSNRLHPSTSSQSHHVKHRHAVLAARPKSRLPSFRVEGQKMQRRLHFRSLRKIRGNRAKAIWLLAVTGRRRAFRPLARVDVTYSHSQRARFQPAGGTRDLGSSPRRELCTVLARPSETSRMLEGKDIIVIFPHQLAIVGFAVNPAESQLSFWDLKRAAATFSQGHMVKVALTLRFPCLPFTRACVYRSTYVCEGVYVFITYTKDFLDAARRRM